MLHMVTLVTPLPLSLLGCVCLVVMVGCFPITIDSTWLWLVGSAWLAEAKLEREQRERGKTVAITLPCLLLPLPT